GEQIPRLAAALAAGEAERTRALSEIAAALQPGSAGEGQAVVAFNSLGFPRRGLVEARGSSPAAFPSAPSMGVEHAAAGGGRLFRADLPSLGYATEDLARAGTGAVVPASLAIDPEGAVAVLENEFLRATLRQDTGWGITSLVDKHSGADLIRPGGV